MEQTNKNKLVGQKNMKIILFGAGKKAIDFLEQCIFMDYLDIVMIVDNDELKWGTNLNGFVVCEPKSMQVQEFDKIVITTHYDEIKNQLIKEYNILSEKITRVEYLIVPSLVNAGTIQLNCSKNECYDINDLDARNITTTNALEEYFLFQDHRIINKWWHYFEIYHEFFQKYVNKPVKVLEIGVYKGGSLQMWKNYFGEQAFIVGIDIDATCKDYEEENIKICIGSQDDKAFLEKVSSEYGPFDIIIDDGSHAVNHQIASFEALYGLLGNTGVYLCEDTHTSYWKSFGGEYLGQKTFVEYAKSLIDELHNQHISDKEIPLKAQFRNQIKSIHFYDSVIVFEKRLSGQSFWSMKGN